MRTPRTTLSNVAVGLMAAVLAVPVTAPELADASAAESTSAPTSTLQVNGVELSVPVGDDVEYTVHCRATSLETGQDASAPPRHANNYQELLDAIKNHPNACVPDENYDRRLGIDVLTRTATGGWEVLRTVEGYDTGGSALDELAEPDRAGGATDPDAPTGTVSEPVERLKAWLAWVGATADPFQQRSDAEQAVDGVMLLRAVIVLALRTALDRGDDTADLAAAYHALGLLGLLLADDTDDKDADDVVSPPTKSGESGTMAKAPRPKKDPPPMEGRAKKQRREWVYVPAPAVVHQTYPTVAEQTLKTRTWYQMKVNDDGSRDFYNKKGKWIGTNPWNDRKLVEVRKPGEPPAE